MLFLQQEKELKVEVEGLAGLIGNTPLYPMSRIFNKPNVKLYAKLEWHQLSGSIKARSAYQMIWEGISQGKLNRDNTVLDASSGNTAIALATICRKLDIPLMICLPEDTSQTRVDILRSLGAILEFTPKFEGTDGAQIRANYLYSMMPGRFFYANQYNNPANWAAHLNGTGEEIWDQTGGELTHFVAGLGTSGTFMGTTRKLKALNPNIKAISLQPAEVVHGLEGWKHMKSSAMVPGIYDSKMADKNIEIETWEAYDIMRKAAETEGLLLSPSSAAALAGAIRVAEKLESGTVVTVLPDDIAKYPDLMKNVL